MALEIPSRSVSAPRSSAILWVRVRDCHIWSHASCTPVLWKNALPPSIFLPSCSPLFHQCDFSTWLLFLHVLHCGIFSHLLPPYGSCRGRRKITNLPWTGSAPAPPEPVTSPAEKRLGSRRETGPRETESGVFDTRALSYLGSTWVSFLFFLFSSRYWSTR